MPPTSEDQTGKSGRSLTTVGGPSTVTCGTANWHCDGPMNIGIRVGGNGTSTWQIDYTVDDPTVVFLTRRWAHDVRGYLKSRSLLASNASGAAPCRSARHTCDAAGRPRPPDPCIRRIQRDRNDSRLREMQRQRGSAKHHAANERCSDDC